LQWWELISDLETPKDKSVEVEESLYSKLRSMLQLFLELFGVLVRMVASGVPEISASSILAKPDKLLQPPLTSNSLTTLVEVDIVCSDDIEQGFTKLPILLLMDSIAPNDDFTDLLVPVNVLLLCTIKLFRVLFVFFMILEIVLP
jgi:hypothetical protein